ncbi:hypothetical protein N7527_005242 [Penicillium freii]|uniref:FAD-binding domain-containing protein n=1 Tax=Penicillium freii TaxID=48697 RepID=A0A101MPE8_PENFR|nr:hypothetical protein N7527_005242 [Penicillium freii]KUM64275.1 hypothetical protein ACN42_g2808 [Penicillium freii]
MPQVIIVGAGLAGLCAAAALRQAGHQVQIFEKSQFLGEVGAAVVLSPNSSSVLAQMGFSFDRARVRQLKTWESVDGITLDAIGSVDQSGCEEKFGMPLMGVHRVDLHNELMRLACDDSQQASSTGAVSVRCGVKVVGVMPDEGYVQLEDGTRHYADLVVAADGLHSVARAAVVGADGVTSAYTGFSAFRFLIPSDMVKGNPEFDEVLSWKSDGLSVLLDTRDKINERHMAWYECQGIAPDIRSWPLMKNDPLRKWSKGKVLLIGDAAHAMLPFGGQGANQALEDGGALGYLFRGVDNAAEIPTRLALFETVRRKRASRIQILSTVRIGKEIEVEKLLQEYGEPGVSLPTNFEERTHHDFSFKLLNRCDEVLEAARAIKC